VFPQDASLNGHRIDELFWLAVELTAPAFIIIVAILGYSIVKFRARAGHKAAYYKGDSPRALSLTLGLVFLVFVGIDVNLAWHDSTAFAELFEKTPDASKALRIRVAAEQFLWSFRYAGADGEFDTPDDVSVASEVHVPTGRPLIFELRSRDVIHSFCLPNMRVKQDVLPGMTTYLTTEATVPGHYEIMCAQLCGFGHYAMRGTLVVETPEDFEKWMQGRTGEFGLARAH
jgi:cytochrome c oxidase subunit 2